MTSWPDIGCGMFSFPKLAEHHLCLYDHVSSSPSFSLHHSFISHLFSWLGDLSAMVHEGGEWGGGGVYNCWGTEVLQVEHARRQKHHH